MAQSDWTEMANSLSAAAIARAVTQGITPPNGGGSFVRGFHALQNTTGVYGEVVNGTDFFPLAEGVRIEGAIQRRGDQNGTMMLCMLESNDVTASGYLLGFTDDEEPSHLVVIKGSPSDGLQETPDGLLLKSTGTYAKSTWGHFRMDIIVQPHGDVHIQLFENDLDSYPVTAAVWVAIPGMPEYIDDALGVNSGSLPYASGGYAGCAFYTAAINRKGFIDHVRVARQL
jgi:hypothetical protein